MKRQTVIHVRQKLSTSERRTCNVLGVARSTMMYQRKDRDEDAAQALAVHVAHKMSAADVLEVLYPLLITHGMPHYINQGSYCYT